MIKLRYLNTLLNIFSILFSVILIRFSIPGTIPKLKEPFSLCKSENIQLWKGQTPVKIEALKKDDEVILEISPDKQVNRFVFECNTPIPLNILFRANSLYVSISTNTTNIEVTAYIHRNGSGGIAPDPKRISSTNTFENIFYEFDKEYRPKVNWLVGDYNRIVFDISNPNGSKDTKIYINKVYFQ